MEGMSRSVQHLRHLLLENQITLVLPGHNGVLDRDTAIAQAHRATFEFGGLFQFTVTQSLGSLLLLPTSRPVSMRSRVASAGRLSW